MKIAVVGAGISGLSAAYYLSKKHKVDLFEKENHFGGHANTIDISVNKKIVPVDTGFIVFNELKARGKTRIIKEQISSKFSS